MVLLPSGHSYQTLLPVFFLFVLFFNVNTKFIRDFLRYASLHLETAAQEACFLCYILNSDQNEIIETQGTV